MRNASIKHLPAVALALAAACALAQQPPTATAPALPPLTLGQRVPEISATDLAGKPVTLESLRGKPLVLQFGSITEPVFRKNAGESEKIAAQYAGKVACVVLYQRESHPADGDALEVNVADGFAFAAPASQEERIKLARQAVDRLPLKQQTVLVDTFNDATSRRFGSRPNMTFLIDANGGLAAAYPWMDGRKLRGAIDAVLAGKPVPAHLQGPMRATTIPAAAFETGGNRLSIAVALDDLTLNDKQKHAILPAIAELMADLREFRETRPAATKPADDLQVWTKRLNAAYLKARAALKDNLTEAEYKTTIDALNRTLPPRLINVDK